MKLAAETWESTTRLSEKSGLPGFNKRAMARGLYARFWVLKDPDARREVVTRCLAICREAVQVFAEEEDNASLAETRAELLAYLRSANELADNYQSLRESFEEAVRIGREAVRDLSSLELDNQLLEALCTAFWFLSVRPHIIVEPSKLPDLLTEAKLLASSVHDVSARIGSAHASLLDSHTAGDAAWEIGGDPAQGLKLYEQGMILTEKERDSLTLGRFYWVLTASAIWRGGTEEYAENRRRDVEKGIAYAWKALDKLHVPYDTTLISATYAYLADCYIDLARTAVESLETKRAWLRNAIEAASKALRLEIGTWGSNKVYHSLGRATYYLATFTEDPAEKVRLLNEALRTMAEEIRIVDRLQPFGWDRGIDRIGKGRIKIELANQETSPENKASLLREAVDDIRDGVEICEQRNDPGHYRIIAGFLEEYGDTLFRLHKLTRETPAARSAILAFAESAELRAKAGQNSLLGSLAWKTARTQDLVGEFQSAADSFSRAADNYRLAAQKSVGAADTLRDLAGYMDAWNCVELARLRHDDARYSAATAEYAKASNILQGTKSWNHLAKHYAACSLVEIGEEASRASRLLISAESFRRAAETFDEAGSKLGVKLQNCRGAKERVELSEWARISSQRAQYCRARAVLEQARLLDMQEKNEESTRLYVDASESFERLMNEEAESKNRVELETMMLFCKAWSEMKQAEAASSRPLYIKASRAFLRAEKSASDDRLRALARANSLSSRALAAGTRLSLTSNARLSPKVGEYLETAANLYRRAGFAKSVHWARATGKFFDALSCLADARTEKSPLGKRQLYDLAGRNFDSAIRFYAKAGFKGRESEARRLFGQAKEEAEIEGSIIAVAGSPVAFQGSMPATLLRDQPLGLERFEAANVTGKTRLTERILKLGSTTTVELELTNTGKSPATLVRLEGVPPEGLEIDAGKLTLPRGEGFLDLQGRRLEHSKTFSLAILLRGNRRGVFEFRPRIITLEQSGNTHISELEPATIIVEEPRLPENLQANTLKKLGSRKLEAPQSWFETHSAREVFQHLSKEFLTDYMARGLNLDIAGWRTMMTLATALKIPRSAFYGPGGRDGAVISELDRRGLVERRIFSEERGRGGAITRVRVAFDTPAVRDFLKQTIVDSF